MFEHPDYEATRQRLMRDPIVQSMALGIDPRAPGALADDGSPSHSLMMAANREYAARAGRQAQTTRVEGYARNTGHVGAVAEAIVRLLNTPRVDWPTPADEQLSLLAEPGENVVAVVPPPPVAGWTGPVKPLRPLGPDDAPHCRTHLQFRSDCADCVIERAGGLLP
jgi:hypothetical protein